MLLSEPGKVSPIAGDDKQPGTGGDCGRQAEPKSPCKEIREDLWTRPNRMPANWTRRLTHRRLNRVSSPHIVHPRRHYPRGSHVARTPRCGMLARMSKRSALTVA